MEGRSFKVYIIFYDGYGFSHNLLNSSVWFPARLMLLALIVAMDDRYWRALNKRVQSRGMVWGGAREKKNLSKKASIRIREYNCSQNDRLVLTIRLGKQAKEIRVQKEKEGGIA